MCETNVSVTDVSIAERKGNNYPFQTWSAIEQQVTGVKLYID
jgi:hypothetical protein